MNKRKKWFVVFLVLGLGLFVFSQLYVRWERPAIGDMVGLVAPRGSDLGPDPSVWERKFLPRLILVHPFVSNNFICRLVGGEMRTDSIPWGERKECEANGKVVCKLFGGERGELWGVTMCGKK